jgi:hypothetical protein
VCEEARVRRDNGKMKERKKERMRERETEREERRHVRPEVQNVRLRGRRSQSSARTRRVICELQLDSEEMPSDSSVDSC